MGTLTANQERLTAYCEHKLPTSCRLSSIPSCCACADERAHAPSYAVYIDGIGFVPRGTRWQRYCWFCKEFWENRVAASGLTPAQTRIPERPSQVNFLEKWYEFHRGYRIIQKENGGEERVAVLGEDFSQVSPGYLPRTLEEMRAGLARSQNDLDTPQPQTLVDEPREEGPSIDDALDGMLAEVLEEEANSAILTTTDPLTTREWSSSPLDSSDRVQVMNAVASRNTDHQLRAVAGLRRELERMRRGVERVVAGLRDLGEDVPDFHEVQDRIAEADRSMTVTREPASIQAADQHTHHQATRDSANALAANNRGVEALQARVETARRAQLRALQRAQGARRARDQAHSNVVVAEREHLTAQQHLNQLRQEQRSMENYTRLFGTREEMAAQGDNYVSPIGDMFNRAYERFRAAEQVRRDERTLRQVLQDEEVIDRTAVISQLAELSSRPRDVWGVPRNEPAQTTGTDEALPEERALQEYYATVRRQDRSLQDHIRRPSPSAATNGSADAQTPAADRERLFPEPINATAEDERLPVEPNATQGDVTLWLAYLRDHAEPNDARTELLTKLQADQYSLSIEQAVEFLRMLRGPTAFLSGVTASIIARRRRNGETVTFDSNSTYSREDALAVQLFAEAYQMSNEVRQRAQVAFGVTYTEQGHILQRLQGPTQDPREWELFDAMMRDPATRAIAERVHREHMYGPLSTTAQRQFQLELAHLSAARANNQSREELDAQRRATQAFAVAAGRTAMQTGPAVLLEQMAGRDEATRAAYDRLQQSGFLADAPESRSIQPNTFRPLTLADFAAENDVVVSDITEEEDELRGLDAADTGRPEAKSDEEMTMKLDCRICYTQVADIACLPCGHLVMCKWCSDQHSPVMAHDHTRPRRAAGCPLCRRAIRQKVRVFRA